MIKELAKTKHVRLQSEVHEKAKRMAERLNLDLGWLVSSLVDDAIDRISLVRSVPVGLYIPAQEEIKTEEKKAPITDDEFISITLEQAIKNVPIKHEDFLKISGIDKHRKGLIERIAGMKICEKTWINNQVAWKKYA